MQYSICYVLILHGEYYCTNFHPFNCIPLFRYWRLKGFWEHINTALRIEQRILCVRESEPSEAILDSQSIKTTETPGVHGYDAGKKIKSRKLYIIVDVTGLLLMVIVHAANLKNRDGAKLVPE